MTIGSALRMAGLTHRGAHRPANEDTVSLNGEMLASDMLEPLVRDAPSGEKVFVLLADGMGGHVQGKLASRLSVTFLWEKRSELCDPPSAARTLEEANRHIYEAMLNAPATLGMGSTIVGLAIDGLECCYFNVGDSRLYHLGREGFRLLTEDDALLSKSRDRRTPRKLSNALTQSLGGGTAPRSITPHTGKMRLEPRDRLLLCSDGLSDMVADDEMESVIGHGESVAAICTTLFKLAMAAGGRDNVSIAALIGGPFD